ncbi:MAG: Sodium:neurotransmitter symporter family protein [bacterium ADurb.Bin236]|nr:MAG: Sodium:neurotransmitter symporter family protein [bacterium ADurb.Bin236]HOY65060.1 sodium-dependent transporter [bacterium]
MTEKRGLWDSRLIFIMAVIGSAVGLGNIWRFPYVCYSNGGGAFLIPYMVALLTAGVPLLILEFGLGHKMGKSAPMAFAEIRKKYEWIGWFAVLIGLMVMTYYGVVMGWCFSYLYYSIDLAWGADSNAFFFKDFLNLSGGIGEIGGIVPIALFGLFLCWLCVFFCIYKGVETVGKVVLLTVPVPIVLLVIFIVRGVTLPGAVEGLKFFLTPDFSALANPKVWLAAYGQVFFSLSIGFGVMIAYASFLPKDSDIVNNAFISSFADALISFIAGLAVFSALGYLAVSTGKPVTEVVSSGPGLAFVTFPAIIGMLPFWASAFGVLFFLLLLTLGIDSAFSLVEAGVAGAMDKWKNARIVVNAAISFMAFAIGIIYTTRAGLYWLDIVDYYFTQYGLAVVGVLECLIVGYVFGAKKLRDHVNATSDFKVGPWWDICIKIITPAALTAMFIQTLIQLVKKPYEGYPGWAQFAGGWGLLALVLIIAVALSLVRAKQTEEE